ncbi:bifunctional 4-hydroxy-2-oxoglutarate aldolase/2-dehydro-3-deoxy-phosphogluconate aldolase [Zobellella sp. DQSA1]|uniref:bifunctional 4-hydroxy-2-oxoglutarate aldolase/2-dehydro-3-deoxy-phosphogluconate aldolase n=1 Tax=Zobellella sp. DQSA1 TaxID=3342386 RepID=UPI0035C061D3
MNWTLSPADVFSASPVVPVMVVEDAADAVPLARALAAGGITVFEVTLRSAAALDAIRAIARELPDALVGAGTVLNVAQYDAAVAAGAKFVITPGFTPALLRHAKAGPVPLMPGIATPSEAMQALELGYTHLKFFPAEINGGAKALKALAGPLPQLRFCPTGGVSAANAKDYLAVKSVMTVGGSWMLPAELVAAKDWDGITRLAAEAVAAVKG